MTVSVLRWSSWAICLVERPCSSRRSTSACRGVRYAGGALTSCLCATGKQSEHSDDAFTVFQRDRADVEHETRTTGGDQDAGRLGRRRRAEHLAREELACPTPFLGADDGREVPPADVAEQALRRRVDPPDNPVSVEHVAGDRDSGQGLLDVAAESEPTPRCRHSDSVV